MALDTETGIAAYEAPEKADLRVRTDQHDIAGCVQQVIDLLVEHGIISNG